MGIFVSDKYNQNIDKSKCNTNEEPHDNYHSMNELYDHRTILFAVLCKMVDESCNTYGDWSWKSKVHSDGTSEDGWFIAGIETPYGQITYHQKIEFWNLFHCKELEKAPKYDGHTPKDVLDRLIKFYIG